VENERYSAQTIPAYASERLADEMHALNLQSLTPKSGLEKSFGIYFLFYSYLIAYAVEIAPTSARNTACPADVQAKMSADEENAPQEAPSENASQIPINCSNVDSGNTILTTLRKRFSEDAGAAPLIENAADILRNQGFIDLHTWHNDPECTRENLQSWKVPSVFFKVLLPSNAHAARGMYSRSSSSKYWQTYLYFFLFYVGVILLLCC